MQKFSAPSREALLRACANGDLTALQSLYEETVPQLFGLALRILQNREQVEDVLQESFIPAWRNARSFDAARGTARAWPAGIVRNKCFGLGRRQGREAPLDEASPDSGENPAPNPADLAALSRD